ncbi:MAG: transglutaminase domain-containing protein [Eggerthellaceae bacterium]|nr:transglutaminase domain-containing protein [Eggerthellaceae bacterium]MBQ9044268.1 transglutaminase domain-containing protein [Eggerthellaceae bacterium]
MKVAYAILALCAVISLAACSGGGAGGSGAGTAAAATGPTGASFDQPASVEMPTVSQDGPSIDISHDADGYVIAHSSSAARLKFQVASGDMTYNYDLPNDDTPTVYPINMGNGAYRFRIMKNTDGNNYVELESVEDDVALSSEFAPFTIPNQFCDYDETSQCVQIARQVTASAANQGEAVQAVCEYVVDNVSYDTDKAQLLSTTTGYIPNPDDTLATGTGVCFDYASLGAAMLRSQGIPTKIITGYVSPGDLYHAWIMVYIDGSWHTGEFSVDPDTWSRVDLTFAASGSTEFTGDGTSYTDRYVY